MNSFKNPLVPLIDDPVNIDRPIQEMQQALASLGWLEKSFGRSFEARKNARGNYGSKELTYPQVWQGLGLDLLEVLPNDNLKSQSFFKIEDPVEVVKFTPDGQSNMRARVSVIFWMNLKEIDATIDYNYIELLKGQAWRKLSTITFSPNSSIQILRVWETAREVFRGYDLSLTRDQELVYPYAGFRFEMDLFYLEDCPGSFDETFDETFD